MLLSSPRPDSTKRGKRNVDVIRREIRASVLLLTVSSLIYLPAAGYANMHPSRGSFVARYTLRGRG